MNNCQNCHRTAPPRRAGVTAVECAFTLPVLLLTLFALLDLGLAAVQYNALVEASQRIARNAIIHGSLAPASSGAWGPAEYIGVAADSDPIVSVVHRVLPTMSLDRVNVDVSWPDNDNSPRDRVQVKMTYQHDPLVPGLAIWGALALRAETTMRIVN